MLEDAWDMVVHSDMMEMETFRCEILIHEQFLSDLANWSQSSRLVSTLNLAYNRPRCQSCVPMKAASKWALANPKGGFLQSLRSPNHEPLLWPSSFPLSCRSHQNRSSSWAFLLWLSQCSCLGIYSACHEKSRTIMRKTASTTQAPH